VLAKVRTSRFVRAIRLSQANQISSALRGEMAWTIWFSCGKVRLLQGGVFSNGLARRNIRRRAASHGQPNFI